MSFGQAISHVFKNYANFNGRARRSEFWFFELFNLIIYLAVSIIDYFVTGGSDSLSFIAILYWLYTLAVLIPSLAVSWRRLHDIGLSGAYTLFLFIPLIGWIFLLAWWAKDSAPDENKFGPNPKKQYRED